MELEVLPTRIAGAAENMAVDFMLLQRCPGPVTPRVRHYGWRGAAFTFGYSQRISFVREQLPIGEHAELCRRPTGGGIVDHRDDWTYALVIPRGHPAEELRAALAYRIVHEALASALRAQGVPAETKSVESADSGGGPGVCFERAEVHDVVNATTGSKIAGAAQKRNRHGLLFQGSICRAAAASPVDWDRFQEAFFAGLGEALKVSLSPVPWPEFNEDELSALAEQYASPGWLELR